MKPTVLICGVIIMLFPTVAHTRARQTTTIAHNAVAKVLQRQILALRAIERTRGCQPGQSSGGFFNACREVALRINEVQQQLPASSGVSSGCPNEGSVGLSRHQKSKGAVGLAAKTIGSSPQGAKEGGFIRAPQNALQFCVRLSDGYYFPTPNSQYGQKGGIEAALTQCRLICETLNMAVYILNDQNSETSDMVSATTNQSYADLPTAYNYHGEGEFKRCNWNGYVTKVKEVLSARKSSNSDGTKAVILKSQQQAMIAAAAFNEYSSINSTVSSDIIRVVGATFIPETQNHALPNAWVPRD